MVHCDVCCLRVSLNKNKTLPKHYGTDTYGWLSHSAQKECAGSGTSRYTSDRDLYGKCSRPRSGQECPCCSRRLTLNKNGKFPKHSARDGGSCRLSDANSS
jgi:hypothetical protein